MCRLKSLCCQGSINSENTDRQSRSEKTEVLHFFAENTSCYSCSAPKGEKTAHQREKELCWPVKKDKWKNTGDKRWMKSRKKDLDFIYQSPS